MIKKDKRTLAVGLVVVATLALMFQVKTRYIRYVCVKEREEEREREREREREERGREGEREREREREREKERE